MNSNSSVIVHGTRRVGDLGLQARGSRVAYVGLLIATLLSPSAHAVVVSEPSSQSSNIRVVVEGSNSAIGILTDVEAHSVKGGTAISGSIQVHTRSGKGAVKMTPQSLRIEFLDSRGQVRAVRNISLGPHEVHRHGAQMPQFDAELDIEPLEGDSLRISIEEPRAN